MSIAENIKYLRKKNKMTQKELAEKSGLAVITIQQYEAGKYEPKNESLYKLRKAFNCNIYEIIDEPFEFKIPNVLLESLKPGETVQTVNIRENKLISDYRQLNDKGKLEAVKRVEELTEIKKYTEKEEPPTDS